MSDGEAATVALTISDGLEHLLPAVTNEKLDAALGAGAVIVIYGTRILQSLNQRHQAPEAEPAGQVIYPPAPAPATTDIATAAGQPAAAGAADAPFAWARPAPGAAH